MKYSLILLLIALLCINSGSRIIVDRAKNVAKDIKCGLHNFGTKIFAHDHSHDPCGERQDHNDHTTHNHQEGSDTGTKQVVKDEKDSIILSTSSTSPSTSTTQASTVTKKKKIEGSPDEKRILNVGSNCKKGQVADADGTCRTEY